MRTILPLKEQQKNSIVLFPPTTNLLYSALKKHELIIIVIGASKTKGSRHVQPHECDDHMHEA